MLLWKSRFKGKPKAVLGFQGGGRETVQYWWSWLLLCNKFPRRTYLCLPLYLLLQLPRYPLSFSDLSTLHLYNVTTTIGVYMILFVWIILNIYSCLSFNLLTWGFEFQMRAFILIIHTHVYRLKQAGLASISIEKSRACVPNTRIFWEIKDMLNMVLAYFGNL